MHDTKKKIGGTLKVALDWEVDYIDPPASFGGWNTGRVVQQIFESLVEDNLSEENAPYTRVVPALATSYDMSDDECTYTFSLRKNVRFHDGEVFDAHAVKINIERMWNPDSPYYCPLAADYNQVITRNLKEVSVIDSHTLEISLKEPFADFLRYMTQEDSPGSFTFVSPRALRQFGNEGVRDRAPGTGPYMFCERFETPHGSGVSLIRNPEYWGGSAFLDKLIFIPIPDAKERASLLQKGEVDLAYGPDPLCLETLKNQGFVISRTPVPYVWYFSFNLSASPFRDIRVRRAVAHAIDRDKMAKKLFGKGARPALGVIPPACPSFEPEFPDFYPYNPDIALKLLSQSGYTNGLSVKVLTARAGSGQLDPLGIWNWIKEDLAKIGVSLEIEIRDDWVTYCEEWRQGIPAAFAASEMSWGMSCDVWLEQVTHSRFASPSGFNTGYYQSSNVDRLLDLARTEQSESRRIELYRIVHRIIMRDLPIYPVLNLADGLVVHNTKVKGFKNPPQNWHDFRGVWIKE